MDDLVEMDCRQAAPVRAWLRLDPSVPTGTLPIDSKGLEMLRAEAGQPIEVRRIATSVMPQALLAEAAE